mgnify:CR=1 FL=1
MTSCSGALGVGFYAAGAARGGGRCGRAAVLWFAFYVKLWAVYALPLSARTSSALLNRRWLASAAFVVTSSSSTARQLAYWKAKTGSYIPFIDVRGELSGAGEGPDARMGPLREDDLRRVGVRDDPLRDRPVRARAALPVATRAAAPRSRGLAALRVLGDRLRAHRSSSRRASRVDKYYTVPRIFRYLAPISFPVALHAAKLAVDTIRGVRCSIAVATASALLVAKRLRRRRRDAARPHLPRLALPRRPRDRDAGPAACRRRDHARLLARIALPPARPRRDGVETRRSSTRPPRRREVAARRGATLAHRHAAHHRARQLRALRRARDNLRLPYFARTARRSLGARRRVRDPLFLPRPETARLWRLTKGVGGKTG